LLTSALKKIAMNRFSFLSGIELRAYFNHKDNFLDTVSQFKKSRNTAALIKSYQAQQKVMQELKLNFPEDPS